MKTIVLFFKNKPAFFGKWYTYHFTLENYKEILREEEWTVKLGFGCYVINTFDKERKDLIYHGKIKINADCALTIIMKSKFHNEEYYIRIPTYIPNSNKIIYGIKVGVNFHESTFSTIYLFSRDVIEFQNASEKINLLMKTNKSKHFLTI